MEMYDMSNKIKTNLKQKIMKTLLNFNNIKDFVLYPLLALIIFVLGFLFLSIKILLLLIFVCSIYLYLDDRRDSLDSLYIFTKEEWKRIGRITAIQEGSSSLDTEIQNYHILKGMGSALFASELKSSISKLERQDQYVILGSDGNVISSPWVATKKNYWKNILNPRKNSYVSKN